MDQLIINLKLMFFDHMQLILFIAGLIFFLVIFTILKLKKSMLIFNYQSFF